MIINKTKSFIWAIIILAWSINASAQVVTLDTAEEDTVINIIADFCKNDTVTYTSQDIEYKISEGDTIVKYNIETDFMIVVRDSTSTGYTLEMTETAMRINEVENDIRKAMFEISWEMAKGIKCVFTTDELGVVKSIVNWREIRDKTKTVMGMVLDTLYAKYEGLDTLLSRNRLEQMVLMQISNEESLRETYDELEMLFGCHGRAWDICNKTWNDNDNGYPSESALKVGYTVQEEETDIEGDYAIWSKTTTRIPVDEALDMGLGIFGTVMTDNMNNELQNSKQAIVDAIKTITNEVTVDDGENYSYFYNGWPKECYKVRSISVGKTHQKVTVSSIVWNSRSWFNLQ